MMCDKSRACSSSLTLKRAEMLCCGECLLVLMTSFRIRISSSNAPGFGPFTISLSRLPTKHGERIRKQLRSSDFESVLSDNDCKGHISLSGATRKRKNKVVVDRSNMDIRVQCKHPWVNYYFATNTGGKLVLRTCTPSKADQLNSKFSGNKLKRKCKAYGCTYSMKRQKCKIA